jgi:hypothetical protein
MASPLIAELLSALEDVYYSRFLACRFSRIPPPASGTFSSPMRLLQVLDLLLRYTIGPLFSLMVCPAYCFFAVLALQHFHIP